MATLKIYKSYSFRSKDPIIDELRTIIKDQKVSYQEINKQSSVSIPCLYGWFNGKTRRPQHATIKAVAHSLGYEYKLSKMKD